MLTLEAPTRADHAPGGEPTLDELIVSAWEGLATRRVVACVVCGGPMAPRRAASPDRVEGRCERCSCALS